MTSNSLIRATTCSSINKCGARGSLHAACSRSASGHIGASVAEVDESPLANNVTSWPSCTSWSVRYDTTRSVPPYNFGGTLSLNGATCAIRMVVRSDKMLIECKLNVTVNCAAVSPQEGPDPVTA